MCIIYKGSVLHFPKHKHRVSMAKKQAAHSDELQLYREAQRQEYQPRK